MDQRKVKNKKEVVGQNLENLVRKKKFKLAGKQKL